MRAILAAAARCEEESLQHHADTRVRLPIALWIPPARLFYETAMENIRVSHILPAASPPSASSKLPPENGT